MKEENKLMRASKQGKSVEGSKQGLVSITSLRPCKDHRQAQARRQAAAVTKPRPAQ